MMNEDHNKLQSEEKDQIRKELFSYMEARPYSPRGHYFVHQMAKSALSIMLLIAFPGLSLLYAAEQALPKHGWLYDIKRGAEEVAVYFQNSPESKIAFREQQIKRRVQEATRLALAGPISPNHAKDLTRDIAAHVASVEETAEDRSDEEVQERATAVRETLSTQKKVLKTVAAQASQDGDTQQALETITTAAATLQTELSEKETEASTLDFSDRLEEVKRTLTAARLNLEKELPKTDTEEAAASSSVSSFTSVVAVVEEIELVGAEKVIADLLARYESLALLETPTEESDALLASLKTDSEAFLELLSSDISLADGFEIEGEILPEQDDELAQDTPEDQLPLEELPQDQEATTEMETQNDEIEPVADLPQEQTEEPLAEVAEEE